jgi:hypothetical protein
MTHSVERLPPNQLNLPLGPRPPARYDIPMSAWSISGEFAEACSCQYLCPCITSNMAAAATEDHCTFAMTYRIDDGHFDDTRLDGVRFSVIAKSKAVMADGGWIMGLVIDDGASDAQADAITQIAGGQAGGPLAAVKPLVGEFRGVERASITFEQDGIRRSVSIPGVLETTITGVPSVIASDTALAIDSTAHPANTRLSLAKAAKYVVSCFGFGWNARSDSNNAHFAPFRWSGSV